jgi:DNA-binding Lrp family transcriptional regulator
MVIGFVLIKAAPALEHEVYTKILKVSQIIELYPLFGEFDLIAKIEAEKFEELSEIIINNIRSVKGVIDTKTLTGTSF